MFRKKKVSLMFIISIVILLLFGCTEFDQNLTIKDEEIPNLDSNGEISLEENNSQETLDNNLKIHFIDVGQGSSVFVVGPDGKTMLYDAGGDDEISGRTVVDYIKSAGYEHIDVAVFTHPHADHINGAPTVFKELKVGSVYYPKVTHTTRTFEKFVDAVSNAGLKFKTAKAGVEIPFGETKAVLVAPISDQYENLNDYSATVKLTWKGKSVLLTGDVEKTSENEMINSKQDLDIDLLLVPHHGSNSSSTDEFLNKTTPDYAVVSSAKDNSYGHPHKEVVDRLNKRNIKTYNTAEVGTVIATLDGEQIDINAVGKNVETSKKEENNKIEKLDVVATISDTKPKQNSDVVLSTKVTSNGKPVVGAKVQILNHYKSKTTPYEGVTDKNGIAEISYGIGKASIDFEVIVDIAVTKDNLETKTQTSFTPQ